jgi:hypothetical protein
MALFGKFGAGIKGIADGANAEVAMRQKIFMDSQMYQNQYRWKAASDKTAAQQLATVKMFDINVGGQTMPITYMKSSAKDENSRNRDDANAVVDASMQPIPGMEWPDGSQVTVLDWLLENKSGEQLQIFGDHFSRYGIPLIDEFSTHGKDGEKLLVPSELGWARDTNMPFWNKVYSDLIFKRKYKHKPNNIFNQNYTIGSFDDKKQFSLATTGSRPFSMEGFTSNWPKEHSLHKDFAEKDILSAVNMLNNKRIQPFVKEENAINYYLHGLGNEGRAADLLKITMDLGPMLKNGYREAMKPEQLKLLNEYFFEYLPQDEEFKFESPMEVLQVLGNFLDPYWVNKTANPGFNTYVDFTKLAERMGIPKSKDLTKSITNVQKPLKRVGEMLRIMGNHAENKSFPSPILRSLALFGNAIKELPGQSKATLNLIVRGANWLKGTADSVTDTLKRIVDHGTDEGIESAQNIMATMKMLREDATKRLGALNLEAKATAAGLSVDDYLRLHWDRVPEEDREALTTANLAVLNYHTYLLAFEMAAAVQGGGDSRTISDRDVRIMQQALHVNLLVAGGDFKAVLEQVQAELSASYTLNAILAYAHDTQSQKDLKAAKLYKAIWLGRNTDFNRNILDVAEKLSGYSAEDLDKNSIRINDVSPGEEETDKTAIDIPNVPVSNYSNLAEFGTVLNIVFKTQEQRNEASDASMTAWKDVINNSLTEEGGYLQEHYETVLDSDVYTFLFSPVPEE